MRFDEPIGPRADMALELLSEGKAVIFRGLEIHVAPSGELECRVFSQWHPENVNTAVARDEFTVGQATLTDLLSGSPQFAAICGRPCRWELLWDYGMGAVRLCSMRDGVLTWAEGLPKVSDPVS